MSDPQPSNIFQFLEQIYEQHNPDDLASLLNHPEDCDRANFDPRSPTFQSHHDRATQNAAHTHQLQTHLAQLQQISRNLIQPTQPTIHLTQTSCISIGLTPRQSEILFHVSQGGTNDAIAQTLGVHPTTIKTHLSQINKRLNATSRLSAVTIARKQVARKQLALKQLGLKP
jgi:DNA-binding CsgD family transcriptional regulator